MKTTTQKQIEITYCNVDRLHYINANGETIHSQINKPTEEEVNLAVQSDEWDKVFNSMREQKTRVSERIYWDMLGCVPPIRHNGSSFFCGEAYSGNKYYFFWKECGFCYGELKAIN